MQKAPAGSFSSLVCFCSLFKACGDLNWGEIVSETNHQSSAASALTRNTEKSPKPSEVGVPEQVGDIWSFTRKNVYQICPWIMPEVCETVGSWVNKNSRYPIVASGLLRSCMFSLFSLSPLKVTEGCFVQICPKTFTFTQFLWGKPPEIPRIAPMTNPWSYRGD